MQTATTLSAQAAKPAAHIAKISAQQNAKLRVAELCGPAELLRFARAEQSKRDICAESMWSNYQLFKPAGARFATHITTPDGNVYEFKMTDEGVKRFIDCPDQVFVDSLNDALRAAGLAYRVESKHAMIWFAIERAQASGAMQWAEA